MDGCARRRGALLSPHRWGCQEQRGRRHPRYPPSQRNLGYKTPVPRHHRTTSSGHWRQCPWPPCAGSPGLRGLAFIVILVVEPFTGHRHLSGVRMGTLAARRGTEGIEHPSSAYHLGKALKEWTPWSIIERLLSLSGMVESPRLQAKQSLGCRLATCHSGLRAGIQGIGRVGILDAGSSPA